MCASALGSWAGQTDPLHRSVPGRPPQGLGPSRAGSCSGLGREVKASLMLSRGGAENQSTWWKGSCHLAQAEFRELQRRTLSPSVGRAERGMGEEQYGVWVGVSRDQVFSVKAPSGQ